MSDHPSDLLAVPGRGDWLDDEPSTPRMPRVPGVKPGNVGNVGTLAVRRASQIVPTVVRWLWTFRVALGKLNILGGAPGLGKSYIATYLAAAVSRADGLPDDDRRDAVPGSVLILSYEDDPEDTLRPRLDLAGADLDRVHVIEGVNDGTRQRALGPDDVALIASYARELGDVQLVIVDPVSAFVGAGTDEHRGNEIRAALEDLRTLAQREGFAVLLVMHTRKAGADTALNRLAGSQAYGALVRSALMVAPVADDEQGRCALAHVKHNLAAKQPTLAYTVADDGLTWHGHIEVDESEVAGNPATEDGQGGRQEAAAFLRDVLADGPVPAREVQDQAKDAGIAPRTLSRAKSSIGVLSARDGRHWAWSLPSVPTTPPSTPGTRGDVGLHRTGGRDCVGGCGQPADTFPPDGSAWCAGCFPGWHTFGGAA